MADRFLREISILTELEHPHIGKLIDCGENDWLIYYAMPFIEGPNLKEHLTRVRQASISDTVQIAVDLLDALQYAHGTGIVHRDVKPENVMLTPRGAVLLDFGIARAILQAGTDRITRSGFAVGTSSYMSPEQIQGNIDIDERSDFYSLGCVLFECLAGHPPHTAKREELVLRLHLEAAAPDVRRFRRETPGPLADAIAKALRHQPADRWQSAGEMRVALSVLTESDA